MNKKIILVGLTWLLFLSSVFAQSMPPQPIGGRIYGGIGSNVGGMRIVTYNQRTGESLDAYSNIKGDWLVEWANAQHSYTFTDEIEITVWACKDESKCKKTVTIRGEPIFVEFDLTDMLTECPKCICEECEVCPECEVCEVCMTDEECKSYCSEIGMIYSEDCPSDYTIVDLVTHLFTLIFGGFIVWNYQGKIKLAKKNIEELIKSMPKGCGIRLFHSYTGESDIKHFHRSPKKYHSLPDRHRGKYDHNGEENLFPELGD